MMMCWLHKIHCKQKTAAENKPLKRIQLQIAPSVFLVVRVKYSMLIQASSLLPKKKRDLWRRGWSMVGCTRSANMEWRIIPFWGWRARTHLGPAFQLSLKFLWLQLQQHWPVGHWSSLACRHFDCWGSNPLSWLKIEMWWVMNSLHYQSDHYEMHCRRWYGKKSPWFKVDLSPAANCLLWGSFKKLIFFSS